MDKGQMKSEINLVETFKEVIDYLSPLQTPTEQAIYNYLLRWSYFEMGNNRIQIGDRTIAKSIAMARRGSKQGMAPQAIGENIRSLEKKGHIKILEVTHLGKIYCVKLPSEIEACIKLKQEKSGLPPTLPEDYFKNPSNRKLIFERDGYKCHYCGQKVDETNATLDHKIPISKGGNNSKENLVTCCHECNSIKSGKTLEEVAPKLLERLKNKMNK